MGTSTSYGGSPKWAGVKNAVSHAAGQGPLTAQKTASVVRAFVAAMASSDTGGFGLQARSGAGNGRRSGGGRARGSVQRNRANVRGAAAAVGRFVRDVREYGLREALRQAGCDNIDGLTPTDLVLMLAELLSGADSTIDASDLRNALCDLLYALLEDAKSMEEAELLLQASDSRLEQIIRDLIGNYIYERFNTTFASRLDARLRVSQSDTSLNEVRTYIETELQIKGTARDLSSVNWKGAEGAGIVEEILQQTIEVFREVP